MRKAAMVLSIAASDNLPDDSNPSPNRTMRVKLSRTRKLRSPDRSTISKRQLLVPKSTAA